MTLKLAVLNFKGIGSSLADKSTKSMRYIGLQIYENECGPGYSHCRLTALKSSVSEMANILYPTWSLISQ